MRVVHGLMALRARRKQAKCQRDSGEDGRKNSVKSYADAAHRAGNRPAGGATEALLCVQL